MAARPLLPSTSPRTLPPCSAFSSKLCHCVVNFVRAVRRGCFLRRALISACVCVRVAACAVTPCPAGTRRVFFFLVMHRAKWIILL